MSKLSNVSCADHFNVMDDHILEKCQRIKPKNKDNIVNKICEINGSIKK